MQVCMKNTADMECSHQSNNCEFLVCMLLTQVIAGSLDQVKDDGTKEKGSITQIDRAGRENQMQVKDIKDRKVITETRNLTGLGE